jgi:hypothetical protein
LLLPTARVRLSSSDPIELRYGRREERALLSLEPETLRALARQGYRVVTTADRGYLCRIPAGKRR